MSGTMVTRSFIDVVRSSPSRQSSAKTHYAFISWGASGRVSADFWTVVFACYILYTIKIYTYHWVFNTAVPSRWVTLVEKL